MLVSVVTVPRWSLSVGTVTLWFNCCELPQRGPGDKACTQLSLPPSLALSSLRSQSTSPLFLQTIHLPFENLFCQELLAAGPRGRAPQVIINLVCLVFLALCTGVGLNARRTLASAHIISDVSKCWLLLGLVKEGHFWGLQFHLVND